MSRQADPTFDAFTSLEQTLIAQEQGYRDLRRLVLARRDAIRVASLESLKATLDSERATIAKLSELDRKRSELAMGLAKRLGVIAANAPRTSEPKLSQLIAKAPTGLRERLHALAERLKVEVEATRHESSVVRDAADQLACHVAGILQTVSAAFAQTKTYGRAGRVATAGAIRSIDIKS